MKYELMLVLKASLTETNEKKILDQIKEKLKNKSTKFEPKLFGKKILAYPIKKEKEANFWLTDLDLEGKEAVSLTDKIKNEEAILRFLLVKKE